MGWNEKCPPVGLVDIIYVWNSVTCFRDSGERLEEFLLADCGNEFLEVERFEVRYVFESFFFVCRRQLKWQLATS